jgi:hypothetical protein
MTKRRNSSTNGTAGRRSSKAVRKSVSPRARRERIAATAKPTAAAAHLPGAPVRPSKKSTIVALLHQPEGAAISELTAATGWQAHSVRAALTGLRKEGKDLVRAKDATGVTHYRLASQA